MAQFVITSKGYRLLQIDAGRAAYLLQVASSIAKDGQVSQDELVEELNVSHEDAEEVLRGLTWLGLIRPVTLPRSALGRHERPRPGYGRLKPDVQG